MRIILQKNLGKNEAEGIGNINKWRITEEQSNIRGDFTIEEPAGALKNAKKGKAPGTDGIIMELLKWLDMENREELLKLFNHWWQTKEAPEEL